MLSPQPTRPVRPGTGLLGMLLIGALIAVQPQPVKAVSAKVHFNIAAQDLAQVLLQLGQQANVEIAFAPGLATGRAAPALTGRQTVIQALETVLAPLGLAARREGDRRYIIFAVPIVKGTTVLDPVWVHGDRPGERRYTRKEIDSKPGGNRDISSLIAENPAVRQDDSVNNSTNRGSLAVEDISIYGASPFQNQFQIDGVSATNQIDPANRNLNLQVGNVPGYSQAYNLDTNMLDGVAVLDSSIPVEFGRFTGGVIDARVRNPKGDNSITADFSYNSSDMTSQKIAEGHQNSFDIGKPGFSPSWIKRFASATVDVGLTENTAAIVNVSRRESTIDRTMRVFKDKIFTDADKKEKDSVDNIFAKMRTVWSADTDSFFTIKYADRQENLVDAGIMADRIHWQNQQKAYGLGFDLNHDLGWGHARLQLSYDQMDSRRNSDASTYMVHAFYGNNGSREYQYIDGGFGRESTEQRNLVMKPRLDLKPFFTGAVEHTAYAGLEVSHTKAEFVRHQDSYAGNTRHYSDGQPDKVQTLNYYQAGRADVSYASLALYLADRLAWKRLALTAGVRMDQDNYFGNTNIAPRAMLEWDISGDGSTVMSGGWSRYYGMDILGTAMKERKSQLHTLLITGGKVVDRPTHTVYRVDGLRTPYDDEWAIRVNHNVSDNITGLLSYVHRNGRQQVALDGNRAQGYFYANEGWSSTDAVSLSIQSRTPWKLGETRWTGRIDATYQHTKRNTTLADGYDGEAERPDDQIYYNNNKIRRADKPVGDYNSPWRVSAAVTGAWPKYGFTLNNQINWRGGRKEIFYTGISSGDRLEKYESGRMGSYWTWDMRVDWKPASIKGITLGVDVLNLLNKQAPLVVSSPNIATSRNYYRTGRELWLRAAYSY
ncbi:TonB-dependent receptor [Allopusillimonas ginsengisoli]|nr:TonB-dependent receptor [Allopusillimonas ginsengisoli]